MDVANSKIITFETLRGMVLNTTSIKSEDRYAFKWDSKTKDVVTKFLSRSIRSTVSPKELLRVSTRFRSAMSKQKASNRQTSKQAIIILIVLFYLYRYNKQIVISYNYTV